MAAGADAEVKLSNLVHRWGRNAPPRSDAAYLPGQAVHFSMDLSGMDLDKDGQYETNMAVELTDATGAPHLYDQPTRALFLP